MWSVGTTTESFHYNELGHAYHQHRPQSHQQLRITKKKRKKERKGYVSCYILLLESLLLFATITLTFKNVLLKCCISISCN